MQKASRNRMPLEERQRQLVEAAVRVMKRHGVAAATTRAVTTEAGMPHGAFRFCFENKTEVFRRVLELDRQTLARQIDAAIDATTIEDAISVAVRGYWQEMTQDAESQQVYQELGLMALRDPELASWGREDIDAYVTQLTTSLDALAEHYGTGWDIPSRDLGIIVYSMVNGLTVTWLFTGDSTALEHGIEEIIRVAVTHVTAR